MVSVRTRAIGLRVIKRPYLSEPDFEGFLRTWGTRHGTSALQILFGRIPQEQSIHCYDSVFYTKRKRVETLPGNASGKVIGE
jgi:hypothetical protein